MIYVGMDVHKRTTSFCAVGDDGQVARRDEVASGEDGWLDMANLSAVEILAARYTGGVFLVGGGRAA